MYDMDTDKLHLGTADIANHFGQVDLYKDPSNPADPYWIEKALGAIEGDAAQIIRTIDSSAQNGFDTFTISREDLNTLRKFLFLMQYCRFSQARRFQRNRGNSYNPSSIIEEYRRKHYLRDAWAVYLRNMALILEDRHWEVCDDERLMTNIRDDYKLDSFNMDIAFYIAPSDAAFVLTNNGLGMCEAGHATVPRSRTYPITPRLTIMLRSPLAEHKSRSYFGDFPDSLAFTTFIPPPTLKAFSDREADYDATCVRDQITFTMNVLTEEQVDLVNSWSMRHLDSKIIFMNKHCMLKDIAAFENSFKSRPWFSGRYRFGSLKRKLSWYWFLKFKMNQMYDSVLEDAADRFEYIMHGLCVLPFKLLVFVLVLLASTLKKLFMFALSLIVVAISLACFAVFVEHMFVDRST
jgi:hypothetical protein